MYMCPGRKKGFVEFHKNIGDMTSMLLHCKKEIVILTLLRLSHAVAAE